MTAYHDRLVAGEYAPPDQEATVTTKHKRMPRETPAPPAPEPPPDTDDADED
jgi:hypothetical protein